MFNIKEVIGIKNGEEVLALESIINTIILVPEALDDIISKINMLGFRNAKDVIFINGYGVLRDGTYINKKGQIITPQEKVFGYFSCNRAQTVNGGFINGLTGQKVGQNYEKTGKFSSGFAPVKNSSWQYINLDGQIASDREFKAASCFFGEYAIVNDSGTWKIINTQFQDVNPLLLNNYTKYQLEVILRFFNDNPIIYKQDNIKKQQNGAYTVFIDLDTGFSIRIYEVLERIYNEFKIPKIEGTPKEQLAYVVSEVASRGTFAINLTTFDIEKTQIVKGVKITDQSNRNIVSFDPEDVAMAKARKMKEGE